MAWQHKNFPGKETTIHFSNAVALGKEVQECLKDIRWALRVDPTMEVYCTLIENLERTLKPYIKLDSITKDSYYDRLTSYLAIVMKELKKQKGNEHITIVDVQRMLRTDPLTKIQFCEFKHQELMNLLARCSLLPIPTITDTVEVNEFEPYEEKEDTYSSTE